MIATTDRVLGALSLWSPMTINELAKRLAMNRWTVAAAVRRMGEKVCIWECVRGQNGRPAYKYGRRP